MKWGILSFLVALVPTVCWGLDDACTKPDEFTIDKRCYVTDEQQQMLPYNTVVSLVGKDGRSCCTGTIIQNEVRPPLKSRLVVYTAKHCADMDGDGLSDNALTIRTQNGEQYQVALVESGDYDIKEDVFYSGDWAIYSIDDAPDGLAHTTLTTYFSGFVGIRGAKAENWDSMTSKRALGEMWSRDNFDAQVVGYGSLEIMSDAEIADFKNKYIRFLETSLESAVRNVYEDENLSEAEMQERIGWYKDDPWLQGWRDDGLRINSNLVQEFIWGVLENSLSFGDLLIFEDNDKLKVSYCQLSTDGYQQGCQFWNGNSGGPIFDVDGRLMGILTRGNSLIGGANHAGRDFLDPNNNDGLSGRERSDGRPDSNIYFLQQ